MDAFIRQTEVRLLKSGAKQDIIPISSRVRSSVLSNDAYLNPSGLIFHSARCGSTLLCNMLDSLPNTIVIRESGIIAKLLNDRHLQEAERSRALRHVIHLYCQFALKLNASCVLKFSSRCTLKLPYLTRLIKSVPWLYLHRNPLDVIHSLVQAPPKWLHKNSKAAVMILEIVEVLHECFSRVLNCFSKNKISAKEDPAGDGEKVLLAYPTLVKHPVDTVRTISRVFSLDMSHQSAEKIEHCLKFDAKNKQRYTKDHNPNVEALLQMLRGDQSRQLICKQNWSDYETLCRHSLEYND